MKWLIRSGLIITLLIVVISFPNTYAKAGGVPLGNYTSLTLDASQALPNCGINAPCHINALNGTDLLVNINVGIPERTSNNNSFIMTINIITNESIDEIGCILMNRTLSDGTGEWAEPVGIFILDNNESGLNDNYHENLSGLSYELTLFPTSIGQKNLTLHCRGGLTTPGNQDWTVEYNITLDIIRCGYRIIMADLNIYSFDIPIINKFYSPENNIVVYENEKYAYTIDTNNILALNNSCNYTLAFKPSKLQLLSNHNSMIILISSYYKVIATILFLFVIIYLLYKMIK